MDHHHCGDIDPLLLLFWSDRAALCLLESDPASIGFACPAADTDNPAVKKINPRSLVMRPGVCYIQKGCTILPALPDPSNVILRPEREQRIRPRSAPSVTRPESLTNQVSGPSKKASHQHPEQQGG